MTNDILTYIQYNEENHMSYNSMDIKYTQNCLNNNHQNIRKHIHQIHNQSIKKINLNCTYFLNKK